MLKMILIVVVFFVATRVVSHIYDELYVDVCVVGSPRVVVSGVIFHQKVLFSKGPAEYFLFYKGEYEESGDVCDKRVQVTESEYERQMYGR